jgi:hypothetical protein
MYTLLKYARGMELSFLHGVKVRMNACGSMAFNVLMEYK